MKVYVVAILCEDGGSAERVPAIFSTKELAMAFLPTMPFEGEFYSVYEFDVDDTSKLGGTDL